MIFDPIIFNFYFIMKNFKDIVAWQRCYELTLLIYDITRRFPIEEEFGLKSQLRRAAVSTISNIAEGFKRIGKKDSIKFYNISQASLEEIKCQILLSYDLEFINMDFFKKLDALSDEASRILYGFIKSQK